MWSAGAERSSTPLWIVFARTKAPSPLRSAGALQIRGLVTGPLHAILMSGPLASAIELLPGLKVENCAGFQLKARKQR